MARRPECRLPDGNGVLTEDNMKPLLAALIAVLAFVARANAQPVADHLKCYKVRDPQAKTTYTADLGGLVAEPGCTIKVPAVMACARRRRTSCHRLQAEEAPAHRTASSATR